MAKESTEPHRISAQQLFEQTANRKIIPCCLSSDIGLGGGVPLGSTVVVGGRAKSGKDQPVNAKILTPNGWKRIGDAKVGDQIAGSDGNFYTINGVFPQDIKDIFKITMEDGSSTTASSTHLWEVSTLRQNKKLRKSYWIKKIKTTEEIKNRLDQRHGKYRRYLNKIDYVKPINFSKKDLKIDPYLMGIYLGDGSYDNCIMIHNPEQDILEKVEHHIVEDHGGSITYDVKEKISHRVRSHKKSGSLKKELINLGLKNKDCYNKFIPKEYLLSCVEDRIKLLHGLVDSDGYCKKDTQCIEFTTSSQRLSQDVKFLVQSLGGRCTIVPRIPKFHYKDEIRSGQISYRMTISFFNDIIPVSSDKHNKRLSERVQVRQRPIKSIEPYGRAECVCISVDSPDNLYVTDDFILTHNTTLTLQFAANAQNLYGSKVFFYNIEGRLTKLVLSQIQGLKLDADHFEIVMPPAIFDKAGNIIGNKKWGTEQWLENIGETITNNKNAIIIVDSIANFSSEKEQSESLGYKDRGSGNQVHGQFNRKYGDLIVPNGVTLFLLTQVIANTSGYGPPLMMKLSNSFRHQADIILFCKSVEKWEAKNDRILGHDINYTVEASALGPPFIELKIPLRYGYGIDNIQDAVNHAINWELIKRSGAWYYLPFIESDGKITQATPETDEKELVKIQGEASIRNWFLVHPEQFAELEKTIKTKIFG